MGWRSHPKQMVFASQSLLQRSHAAAAQARPIRETPRPVSSPSFRLNERRWQDRNSKRGILNARRKVRRVTSCTPGAQEFNWLRGRASVRSRRVRAPGWLGSRQCCGRGRPHSEGIRRAPPPSCACLCVARRQAEVPAGRKAAVGSTATLWFVESHLFLPDLLTGHEPHRFGVALARSARVQTLSRPADRLKAGHRTRHWFIGRRPEGRAMRVPDSNRGLRARFSYGSATRVTRPSVSCRGEMGRAAALPCRGRSPAGLLGCGATPGSWAELLGVADSPVASVRVQRV
jgi:hypothetical protein